MEEGRTVHDKYVLIKSIVAVVSLIVSCCLNSSRGLLITTAFLSVSFFADYFQFGDEITGGTKLNNGIKLIMHFISGCFLAIAILLLFATGMVEDNAISFKEFDTFTLPFEVTYNEFSTYVILATFVFGAITVMKPYLLTRAMKERDGSFDIFSAIDRVFQRERYSVKRRCFGKKDNV